MVLVKKNDDFCNFYLPSVPIDCAEMPPCFVTKFITLKKIRKILMSSFD